MNAIMIFKYFYTFSKNRYLFLACSQFIEANGSKIKNFGLFFLNVNFLSLFIFAVIV